MVDDRLSMHAFRDLVGLKTRSFVMYAIVLGVVLAGFAYFRDPPLTAITALGGGAPQLPMNADASLPFPPQRGVFLEEFTLPESGVFETQGVTVRVRDIETGDSAHATVGASAEGPVEFGQRVVSGSELRLSSRYCDSLLVRIKSISLSSLPGSPEGAVSKTINGQIEGHCKG